MALGISATATVVCCTLVKENYYKKVHLYRYFQHA